VVTVALGTKCWTSVWTVPMSEALGGADVDGVDLAAVAGHRLSLLEGHVHVSSRAGRGGVTIPMTLKVVLPMVQLEPTFSPFCLAKLASTRATAVSDWAPVK